MQPNIRIMPCLDMEQGRVVKGVHFVNIRDAGDPVACAQAYCAAGADELAMLDITATVENRATLIEVVKRGGDRAPGRVSVSLRRHCHSRAEAVPPKLRPERERTQPGLT